MSLKNCIKAHEVDKKTASALQAEVAKEMRSNKLPTRAEAEKSVVERHLNGLRKEHSSIADSIRKIIPEDKSDSTGKRRDVSSDLGSRKEPGGSIQDNGSSASASSSDRETRSSTATIEETKKNTPPQTATSEAAKKTAPIRNLLTDIQKSGGINLKSLLKGIDRNEVNGAKGGNRYLKVTGKNGVGLDQMAQSMLDKGWNVPIDEFGKADTKTFTEMLRKAVNRDLPVHPDDVERLTSKGEQDVAKTANEPQETSGDKSQPESVGATETGTQGGGKPATTEKQEAPDRHYLESALNQGGEYKFPGINDPAFERSTLGDIQTAIKKAMDGEPLGKIQKLIVERVIANEKELEARHAEVEHLNDAIEKYVSPEDVQTALDEWDRLFGGKNEVSDMQKPDEVGRSDVEVSGMQDKSEVTEKIDKSDWKQQVSSDLAGDKKVPTIGGEQKQGGKAVGTSELLDGFTPEEPLLLHAGVYGPEAIKSANRVYQYVRNLPGVKETFDGIQMFLNPGSLQSLESRKALGALKGEKSKVENRMGVLADRALDGRTWTEKIKDLVAGTDTIGKRAALLGKSESIKALDNIRTGNFDALPEVAKKVWAIGTEFDKWFSNEIVKLFPDFPLRDNHGMLTVQFKDAVDIKGDAFPYYSSSMEGTKNFMKKYSGKTVSEIIASGKDISEWNLWKIFTGSLTDHVKFLRTANYMRDGIDSGRLNWVPKGERAPEGLKAIPDRVAKTMTGLFKTEESETPYYAKSHDVINTDGEVVKQFPNSADAKKFAEANGYMKQNAKGETVPNVEMKVKELKGFESGTWYGPKAEMVELERYLAHDAVRQWPIVKLLGEVKGLVTSTELYGAFHFSTIGKESVSNRVSNALMLATAHDWQGAAKMLQPLKGKGAFDLWKDSLANPKSFADSPEAKATLEKMGFTPEKWVQYQDLLYRNGFKIEDNSDHTSKLGEFINTSTFMPLKGIRIAKDAAMVPLDYLFKTFVPSRKTTSAMLSLDAMAKTYADRIKSGEITMDELAKRQAVHHDNVFGQLNYDSLGIDKNFKTVLQLALRAPGWQLGNIRSVVNAFRYQGKEFARSAHTGEAPILTPEMSWMLSTMAVHMAESAVIGYTMAALTGDDRLQPQEFTDLLYPKISAVTKVMPPGYVKDWAAMIHGVQTAPVDFFSKFATSKLAGHWGMLEEWRKNRDYYGTQVYNPDDSTAEQAVDTVAHFLPKPIAYKSATAETQSGETNPAAKIMSLMGYNKVPKWTQDTAAITKAQSFHAEYAPRTKEEKDHADLIKKLAGQLMNDRAEGEKAINQAQAEGKIGQRDHKKIVDYMKTPPLEKSFKSLNVEQAMSVWQVATPEERKELRPMMNKKIRNTSKDASEDRARIMQRWNKINKGE